MKTTIKVYCMNDEGRIVGGLITGNELYAREFVARKNKQGFITITKRGK